MNTITSQPSALSPLPISFCIPTRNRARFLAQALSRLSAQTDSNTEFVIVDGASQDDTAEVVERFRTAGHRVVYFRRDTPIGVDRDILKAVELASSTYCWLMSDDDCLEPGTFRHVLDALSRHPDVAGLSLNTVAYDSSLSYRIRTVPAVPGNRAEADMFFEDREKCFSLLGLHFGFISGQIIHRETWLRALADREISPFCNSWIIVYAIGEMLRLNPKWLYLHRGCISYRSGNDSFSERLGVYRRQLVTHVDYAFTLAALFGGNSSTYKAVMRTLVNDRMPRTLAMIKADGASPSLQWKLAVLYIRSYWIFPAFWFKVAPLFLLPNALFRCIRALYFHLRSSAVRGGQSCSD